MTEALELDQETLIAEDDLNAEQAAEADANLEAQESEEAHEVEIVLEGDEESQGDKPNSYFVAERLKRKNEKLATSYNETEQELERLRRENADLKGSTAPKRPQRDDYYTDEDYDKAVDEWADSRLKAAQQPAVQAQPQQEQENPVIKEKLTKHYEGVRNLRISNYDACEEKVIEILGEDVTRGAILAAGDQSPQLIGYWGSNPQKLSEFVHKVQSGQVDPKVEIGMLRAKLQIRPKRSQAPDPESKVDGAGVPSDNSWAARVKAAYNDPNDPVGAYLELSREAEAAGVNLRDYDTD